MTKAAAREAQIATELLLKSIFWTPQACDTGLTGASGFQVIRPHVGAGFYYSAGALLDATLFIRRHASPHLRSLSIEDLQGMLLAFVDQQFDRLQFAWWQVPEDRPFADHLSPDEIRRLADAMDESPIFVAPEVLFLFPLSIVQISAPFRSKQFFLLPPAHLSAELTDWYEVDELEPYHHPPIPMHGSMPPANVSGWLGITAPDRAAAERVRKTIMGACALLPHPLERYLFSMRMVPKGYCSLERRATYHTGDASSPPLSEDLIFTSGDHEWQQVLVTKLLSNADRDRKDILSLQYFFRAWVKDPAARVAPLCGALDALFGDKEQATQAMVDAVGTQLGPTFDAPRVRWLAKLRAGVIHGGAPNIYEASVYHRYWAKYRCDPIRDLELVTARCLQRAIFGQALVERPHTYADLLRQHTE